MVCCLGCVLILPLRIHKMMQITDSADLPAVVDAFWGQQDWVCFTTDDGKALAHVRQLCASKKATVTVPQVMPMVFTADDAAQPHEVLTAMIAACAAGLAALQLIQVCPQKSPSSLSRVKGL